MLRGLATWVWVLGSIFLYILVTWKITEVKPTLGRILQTPFIAGVYGLIGTIVATIFIGPHAAIWLFIPIFQLSLPKAWKEAGPSDPTKEHKGFWPS
jgi:hypothetical protein